MAGNPAKPLDFIFVKILVLLKSKNPPVFGRGIFYITD